jgi:hypothetical protein
MNKEKLQRWLDNEFEKDKIELENDKNKFIENLKKIKKEEIFKTKKLSLWQRIKKVLMGW